MSRNIDTIFLARGEPVQIAQKCAGTRYAELMFLHLVGSAAHIVHIGALGSEMSTQYFSCSGETSTDRTKSALEHVMSDMCFCIQRDLRLT
jgi:hypothetical protein